MMERLYPLCILMAIFAGPSPLPEVACAADDEKDRIVRKGIEVILAGQSVREWPYEGVYRVPEGTRQVIPLGYRVGGTAIACTALMEVRWDEAGEDRRRAIRRGLDFVLESLRHPLLSGEYRGGYDVRGWAHIYTLEFLLRMRSSGRVAPACRGAAEVPQASLGAAPRGAGGRRVLERSRIRALQELRDIDGGPRHHDPGTIPTSGVAPIALLLSGSDGAGGERGHPHAPA